MKPSSIPSQVKINLTKIINTTKEFNTTNNNSYRPLLPTSSSKHSLNQLPPSEFLAGKQFSSIDHHLYNRIINGEKTTIQEQKPQSTKFQQNSVPNLWKQSNICSTKKYAFLKSHKPFQQTTNTFKQRQYAGRLTIKEYNRKMDIMNRSFPLQAWKQLSKSYSKMQKQNEGELFQPLEHKQIKNINKKIIQLLINCQKQNFSERLHKTEQNLQVQDLVKKCNKRHETSKKLKRDKRDKKEGQLEQNIVLKKSFSCKIPFENLEQNHYNIRSFLTEQSPSQLPGLKKQTSKKYKKNDSPPTETKEENPILLLHKEPLQQYMQILFDPTEQVTSPKKKAKPLELMRIKTKKLNTRNVECLERLKKNLFKDKTRRDLFVQDVSKSTDSLGKQNDRICKKQKTDEIQKKVQQQKGSSKISRNQSFCKFFKPEPRKSTKTVEKIHTQNKQPELETRPILQENKKSQVQIGQLQKQSLKSSKISFSQEPTPQITRKALKNHSLINAW